MVAAASLALLSGSLLLAATPSQASAPAASAKTITGSHPAWATASADAGSVSSSAEITGTVYLAGQDPAGLTSYATAVSDPSNASYGKFLSPAQYQARFGATKAQIAAVQKWAEDSGLKVLGTTSHAITVKGTNSALTKAFGTGEHQYKVSGELRHAPARDLKVPASVSSAILGVDGLSSVGSNVVRPDSHKVTSDTATSAKGAKADKSLPTTPTCSAYWGQKTAKGAPAGFTKKDVAFDQCSLYPSQIRKAYGITSTGLTGKGATIAIVDAYGSSTMEADANQYATNHGDKAFKKGQYSEVVDSSQWTDQDLCGGPEGWAPEEALDVEMAHGLAPDANVVYVGANSCNDDDLLAAITKIVDNHLADVVSNSWGEIMHTTDNADVTASEIAAYEQIFQQAAIEGISVGFSAGDCGDSSPLAAATGANCQTDTARAQANWPDSDPWVTSVGGTALALADKSGKYGFETDMGTTRSALSADGKSWTPALAAAPFYFGGGGGTSEDFAQPGYQRGVVPDTLSHTLMTGQKVDAAKRVTPDISMVGDLYTSVLVGISDGAAYSEGGYGGTSVSSPEFAAVQADAIQAGHHAIGFANPAIYARSHLTTDVVDKQAQHSSTPLSSVYDAGVVNGNLLVRLIGFGQDTSLNAVRGYDDATGVGSPNASYLKSYRF